MKCEDLEKHKPAIETMINTSALALTSFGVLLLTTNYKGWECLVRGFFVIGLGAGLEYFKYYGRKIKLW